MNVNMVTLAGRLTRDVQLSYLPSQTPVAEFGMAINKYFKKQDGSKGEKVCFVDVVFFGKRGEVINKYFKKGDQIFVTGELKFDSWQAQDGSKRSKLSVNGNNFEFVDSNGQRSNDPAEQGEAPYGESQESAYSPPNNGIGEDFGDDDIPF